MLGFTNGRVALGERARRDSLPPRGVAAAALVLALLLAAAGPVPAAAEEPEPAAGDEPRTVVSERLTVTDTRLRDRPADGQRVAAHVTVLDRATIAAAGAVTLQELLAPEAGIVLFDATGSDVQQTLDLRGFTGGGVKVFLDGAPLNDPRNNSLSLELVDPGALERVEIHRGSGSALGGGGSQAGVINLWTRGGDDAGGRLRLAAGSFGTRDGSLAGWGRSDRADWFGAASLSDGDGYRVNGGARLGRLGATIGGRLGGGELRLSLAGGDGEFGNPGALRPDELAVDRRQAPFNEVDFSAERKGQATVNYDRLLAAGVSLRANLFARDRRSEILTTGRAAPAFGGFFLDSESRLAGSTAQISHAGGEHELVAGVDWLDADTDARGFSTPPDAADEIDRLAPGSDNLTTRRTTAVYLQDRWRPRERLTLTLAGRWDEDRVGYREELPDPTNADRRSYSELSLRGGLTWAVGAEAALYASYGESFLPPTVEELFSFPLFGSNPELEPEDARSIEIGLRRFAARHQVQAALFQIDTRDEIVFDPDSRQGLFGANVNAGETRRRGLELAYRGRSPAGRLRWFATVTGLDAEFRSGDNRGRTVPLVPEHRVALGVTAELRSGLTVGGDLLRVGEQVLDNDDANLEPPLAAYTVVDARLRWDLALATARGAAPTLVVVARNLLGEEYAGRGIFAFDFSTFTNSVFLTPAPERRFTVGLEWGL